MSEVKIVKQWLQMGAELEGSWVRPRVKVAADIRGARAVEDRSVHIGHGDPGEIVTRPHGDLDALLKDISDLWPDTVHDSCGFHIHASFTPLSGSIIASSGFYAYFKDEWHKWGHQVKLPKNHEFWTRLTGGNKFAKDRFEPEAQLKAFASSPRGGESRYTMLNFHAWEKHRTIECRLLPMFADKDIALSAVRKLAEIYDVYLSINGFPSLVFEPKSNLIGEAAVETYEYVVPDTTPKEYFAEGYFPAIPAGEGIFYSIEGAENIMHPFSQDTKKTQP